MDIYNDKQLTVRPARREEWEEVMGLAWRTFLRFEADDYTEEGVRSFQDFITDQTLHRVFLIGEYQVFVAEYKKELVGMISLRSRNHISLLFVDEKYHMHGVGRRLIEYIAVYLLEEMHEYTITVHSSPYAVGFYHKIGFTDVDVAQEKDGIKYTPMQLEL